MTRADDYEELTLDNIPKTLAVAKRLAQDESSLNRDYFAFGDALIKEVGPPGSWNRFKEVAALLRSQDYDWAPASLKKFRDVAHAVISGARAPLIAWDVYKTAFNGKCLDMVDALQSCVDGKSPRQLQPIIGKYNKEWMTLPDIINTRGRVIRADVTLVKKWRERLEAEAEAATHATRRRLIRSHLQTGGPVDPELISELNKPTLEEHQGLYKIYEVVNELRYIIELIQELDDLGDDERELLGLGVADGRVALDWIDTLRKGGSVDIEAYEWLTEDQE